MGLTDEWRLSVTNYNFWALDFRFLTFVWIWSWLFQDFSNRYFFTNFGRFYSSFLHSFVDGKDTSRLQPKIRPISPLFRRFLAIFREKTDIILPYAFLTHFCTFCCEKWKRKWKLVQTGFGQFSRQRKPVLNERIFGE